jgi:hypothetical protein
MTILPDSLQQILAPYLNLLFQWFSDQVYQRMLQVQSQHWVVQIHHHLDFQRLEAACQDFHHRIGPGAKPTHRVTHLVRALLLKYLFNLSYRQLEAALQTNLLLRWFAGYSLFETVLDHSTLERFEVWVSAHQHRIVFDEVLRQIDESFPDERQAVQIGDTFAMRADAAEEGLLRRLRHSGECLLRELRRESLEQYQQVISGLDLGPLLGHPQETNPFYLEAEEQRLRLERTVLALLHLQQRVRESGSLERLLRVSRRLQQIDKILQDELDCQTGAIGQVERVEQLPKAQRGSYRIISATDPEASYRLHGKHKTLGYNIQVAASAQRGLIREIQAGTGAQPDQAGVASLVAAQLEQGYECPAKLIYDQAGGAGKTRAEVERISQRKTQLVAKTHTSTTGERFGPADFKLAADGQAMTCPNGITTTVRDRSPNREGDRFCWSAKQCQGCPLWSRCRQVQANATGYRRVFVSDYHEAVSAAQQYNQTPAFRSEMKLRPRIERIIAVLTRYDGARRAHSRGLHQADFQAKMCATARNLRIWIQQLQAKSRATPAVPGLEQVG